MGINNQIKPKKSMNLEDAFRENGVPLFTIEGMPKGIKVFVAENGKMIEKDVRSFPVYVEEVLDKGILEDKTHFDLFKIDGVYHFSYKGFAICVDSDPIYAVSQGIATILQKFKDNDGDLFEDFEEWLDFTVEQNRVTGKNDKDIQQIIKNNQTKP